MVRNLSYTTYVIPDPLDSHFLYFVTPDSYVSLTPKRRSVYVVIAGSRGQSHRSGNVTPSV